MSRSVRRIWAPCVALTVLLCALSGPGAAFGSTAPSAASITLDPTVGPPTTKVTVDGSGFGSTEKVVIRFDGTKVATATTDGSGSFGATVKVPAPALPGDHQVKA